MPFKPGDLGVAIYRGVNPMEKPCKNCPWTAEEEGRGYLHERRMEDLRFAATLGQPFWCHKTVYHKRVEMTQDEDGWEQAPSYDPHYRQCAGANRYALRLAKERGITPDVLGDPFPEEG